MVQNRQIVEVVKESCQMVLELAILAEDPVKVHIWELAVGVHEVKEEMAKV